MRRGVKAYSRKEAARKEAVRRECITRWLIGITLIVVVLAASVLVHNYILGSEDSFVRKIETVNNDNLIDRQVQTVEQDTTEDTVLNTIEKKDAYRIDDFQWLSQYPELPTGCEITSLTAVMNYYGINVSKEEMSDNYLAKGWGSFYEMFLGNPRNSDSFGCMAKPIVDAANKYFKKNSIDMEAVNISGIDFSDILEYVADGNPVIIWNTMGMAKAYESQRLILDDKEYMWIAPEHCVVLLGYDINENEVYVSDPQVGIVIRNMDAFEERYESLHRQAVCIER